MFVSSSIKHCNGFFPYIGCKLKELNTLLVQREVVGRSKLTKEEKIHALCVHVVRSS